jgi:hypothetical protein
VASPEGNIISRYFRVPPTGPCPQTGPASADEGVAKLVRPQAQALVSADGRSSYSVSGNRAATEVAATAMPVVARPARPGSGGKVDGEEEGRQGGGNAKEAARPQVHRDRAKREERKDARAGEGRMLRFAGAGSAAEPLHAASGVRGFIASPAERLVSGGGAKGAGRGQDRGNGRLTGPPSDKPATRPGAGRRGRVSGPNS